MMSFKLMAISWFLVLSNVTAFTPSLRPRVAATTPTQKLFADSAKTSLELTTETKHNGHYCIPLDEIRLDDLPKVGG